MNMAKTTNDPFRSAQKEPYHELLEPEKLRLFRDGSGHLRLTVEGDRSYLDVKVVRAFPLSEPERYIGLLDARSGDKVIGLVPEPQRLDAQSKQIAAEALERHYFVPTITRVVSLTEEFGAVYCDVETDRGPRHFVARGIRDALEDLGDGELLIPDVDGNRYHVADWRGLDPRSRALLERVV
ncbi:MAG: DUF1854 domain-containing protein [Candidatus Brocadiae bacterium]|nr:DUF1854 domain-containing protein [Candidatus Brocadiia bacterium]